MATTTEYLKNIPIIPADATIADRNIAYHVIGSILSRNKAKQFLSMTKHVSLPDTEVPGPGLHHLADEVAAEKKHGSAMHVMVLACQKNLELTALLQQTETTDWPGGEMHKFIKGVEKHFKLTVTTPNTEKQEIKKERELDKLAWERNNNLTAIWKKLALLTLKYKLTSPISDNDKKKWITKHAPSGYNDTIRNAPVNLCQQNVDFTYVATYEDMQNEINEKYESFVEAKAKQTELTLMSAVGAGGGQGGRGGGGRGRGSGGLTRQHQSKRDKAAYKKKNKGKSPTSSGKQKCYYC